MTSKPRTVLHVDDDPQILTLVQQRLVGRNYQVISLEDPRRATEMLLENEWRVVILDIDMPELNGLELLRQIKTQDGGVQAIMLTGMVSMSTVLRSLRWGAEACVFKPLTDVTPLVSALDAAFAKLDRWWETLRDLAERTRAGTACIEQPHAETEKYDIPASP